MISKDKYIFINTVGCTDIMCVGDIHGEFGQVLLNCNRHKKTLQIYCGDIGMGFYKPGYYKTMFEKINKRAERNNCKIIFVRGNHDNPKYFYNEIDGFDSLLYSNIWMAQDWQIFGTKFGNILCGGGAISVDRNLRTKDKEWWPNERIDYIKYSDIFEGVEDKNIDIVITHSAPKCFQPFINKCDIDGYRDETLYDECERERGYLAGLYEYITRTRKDDLKYWMYGHFHKHYCYNSPMGHTAYGLDINEVKYLDILW